MSEKATTPLVALYKNNCILFTLLHVVTGMAVEVAAFEVRPSKVTSVNNSPVFEAAGTFSSLPQEEKSII